MNQPLLTEEDLANIDEALRMADETEENIMRAEQAGLDITVVRDRLDQTKQRLRRIRSAFFPNR